MVQALALVILIVIGAAIYNKFTKSDNTGRRKPKSGDIIDISDAWIAMDNLPYRGKDNLLTSEELAVFKQLVLVVPGGYVVLPKIRLAELLVLPSSAENRQAYQGRINDRVVDLVLCSEEMRPLLVIFIENDLTGRKKQIRDGFAQKAVEAAGLPWISVPVNPLLTQEELRSKLDKALVLNK